MSKRGALLAGIVMLGASVAAVAQGSSRQDAYNRAQEAFDGQRWQEAVDGFKPLLRPEGSNSATDGLIRARYAAALGQLNRFEESKAEILRALIELAGRPPADAERLDAELTLARAHAALLELPEAMATFGRVQATAPLEAPQRREGELGVAMTGRTVDPRATEAAIAHAIASPDFEKWPKDARALAYSLQASARLNAGDPAGAIPFANQAISLTGGAETSTINVVQSMVRQDAALVMLRANKTEDARRLLAHAGGGHMPDSSWLASGGDMPVCDDILRPDDVAVVQFSVGDDGFVTAASPIYASRPGTIGSTFAAKVRDWEFNPARFAKLPAFWRAAIRVEMRCVSRPPTLDLAKPFSDAATAWFRSMTIPTDANSQPIVPPGARPPVVALVETLRRTGRRLPSGAKRATAMEIGEAIGAAGGPPVVQAFMAYTLLAPRGGAQRLAAELADRYAGDPEAIRIAAWLNLVSALALEDKGDFAGAHIPLDKVLAMPVTGLSAGDPIRVVAILHRAIVDERLGAPEDAKARIDSAGLDPSQCALFDLHPLTVNKRVGSDTFPEEAQMWGFDGYVRVSYDINADGSTKAPRTIFAYPPFTFGDASVNAAKRFRFLPPKIDGQVVGCTANMQSFRFSAWRPSGS